MSDPQPGRTSLGKELQDAVVASWILQTPLAFLAALVLYGGDLARHFFAAMLVLCVFTAIVALRRPHRPSKLDLWIVRYGVIPIVVALTTVTSFFRM